jgi:hypothetical protein
MRDSMKSTVAWSIGWLWVVVLLVLPNCAVATGGLLPPESGHLHRGAAPRTSAIMCDIEQNVIRHCPATPEDLDPDTGGIRLEAAAIALNTGRSSRGGIALDDSEETVARCGGPEAIVFVGPFPEGSTVCLNCSVIGPSPSPHPDAHAVCVAQCEDILAMAGSTADEARVFCESHARASTNFPVDPMDRCFADACAPGGGMLLDGFTDPRRTPELVVWRDRVGVSVSDTSRGRILRRIGPTTGPGDSDISAGALSEQWITRGDAYVEFSAGENNLHHIVGFAAVPAGCTSPAACPDTTPSIFDVSFALELDSVGNVWVRESGTSIRVGPFMGYAAGDRFRVTLTDTFDQPRKITYSRIASPCMPGSMCRPIDFWEQRVGPSSYPVRVIALFRDFDATVTDVRIVFIHQD